ncbi:MAG: TauD/TfdA family dioxygenase [Pseudomonadota bacterium]
MTDRPFRIDPITPAIGAEISGLDLNRPLDPATQDAVYQALLDHLMIVFRGQEITPEAHLALAQSFGALDRPHPIYPHVEGFDRIMLLENGPGKPPDTNDWHTDLTYYQNPPFASVLYAVQVPPAGGDTLWASMYAAYDALPEDMKRHLEGREAVHDMGNFRNGYLADGGPAALNAAMAKIGSAVHRMVQRHPVTGRPHLYVNPSFTQLVVGETQRDSDRLLTYLYDHQARPEFQMRHRWARHDLVMWDNRVTQHYACADYLPQHRRMHRVTVVEDRRAAAEAPRRAVG